MAQRIIKAICVGPATVDIKARPYLPIIKGSESSGNIFVCSGGVGLTMARNLAQLGMETYLCTLVGDDTFGEYIIQEAKLSGVQVKAIQKNTNFPTAIYSALLNTNGITEYAVYDGKLINNITPSVISSYKFLIKSTDLIITNSNLKLDTLEFLADIAKANGIFFFFNVTKSSEKMNFENIFNKTSLLGINNFELESILGYPISPPTVVDAGKELLSKGIKEVIVTLGKDGVFYCNSSIFYLIKALPSNIVDTTGAGDALCSAFLYYRMNNASIEHSLFLGLTAASITVESENSVCPMLSQFTIEERYKNSKFLSSKMYNNNKPDL